VLNAATESAPHRPVQ